MAQCIIHVKCIIVNSIHSVFHLNPAEATSADPGGKTSENCKTALIINLRVTLSACLHPPPSIHPHSCAAPRWNPHSLGMVRARELSHFYLFFYLIFFFARNSPLHRFEAATATISPRPASSGLTAVTHCAQSLGLHGG